MNFGIHTVNRLSPFGHDHLGLVDKAGRLAVDVFEVAIEEPELVDPARRSWACRHRP